MRAFWMGLVLFGVSLWAIAATPSRPSPQALRGPAFDQVAALPAFISQRGFASRLDQAKPRQDRFLGQPTLAAAELASGPTPAFAKRLPWTSATFGAAEINAHHYSATGPPGHQPS